MQEIIFFGDQQESRTITYIEVVYKVQSKLDKIVEGKNPEVQFRTQLMGSGEHIKVLE